MGSRFLSRLSKRSRQGFSVVEILIATGLIGVIAIALVALLETGMRGNKLNQENAAAGELIKTLNALLSDANTCVRNFGPTGQNLTLPAASLTVDLVDATGAMKFDVASSTAYEGNLWLIDEYSIVTDFLVNAGPPQIEIATVRFKLSKLNPASSVGSATIFRSLRMWVQTAGPSSPILSCHSIGTTEQFWHSNNGVDIFNSNSGNVGIGNTTPQSLLHLGSDTYSGDTAIRIGSGNGVQVRTFSLGVPYGNTNVTGRNYDFVIRDETSGADRFSIDWGTGNVGINNPNPATPLHVGGHITAETSDTSGFAQLWSDNALIWKRGNSNGGLRFGAADDLAAGGWAQHILFADNGNVRIGAGTATSRLTVNPGVSLSSSLPTSWTGGLHTWDIYANGTIGAGPSSGNIVNAWLNSTGDGYFSSSIGVGNASAGGAFRVNSDGDAHVTGGADARWALYKMSGMTNVEKVVLDSPGNILLLNANVGIGTAPDPNVRLEVAGTIRPGGVSMGGGCVAEGSMGYDYGNHRPVYCSQAGVWTPLGSLAYAGTYTLGECGGGGSASPIYCADLNIGTHSICTLTGFTTRNDPAGHTNTQEICSVFQSGASWFIRAGAARKSVRCVATCFD